MALVRGVALRNHQYACVKWVKKQNKRGAPKWKGYWNREAARKKKIRKKFLYSYKGKREWVEGSLTPQPWISQNKSGGEKDWGISIKDWGNISRSRDSEKRI